MSRHDDVALCGFTLRVAPTVFHPKLFFTSRFLGEHVLSLDLRGKTVLDMGTGSGIIGLCAARAGAEVVSVDINPAAVECARVNAATNRLSERIRCIHSNLFSSLSAGERFDCIVWNPPFYRSAPRSDAEYAWNAGADCEALRSFAADSDKYLKEGGMVLLILSSDIAEDRVLDFFSSAGFRCAAVARRKVLFETLTIFQLTKR